MSVGLPALVYGLTTRAGGSLRLGMMGADLSGIEILKRGQYRGMVTDGV